MKTNCLMIFFCFFVCLLSSCTSKMDVRPRLIEDYYVATGVNKYFLTDLPNWANFDQAIGCYRSTILRYFDLDALMKSYSYSYNQALQIQASFNEEFLQLKKINDLKLPIAKEEERLFYKVSEKVSNHILFFDPPAFKRIHLVWLDEALNDDLKLSKLKKLLSSSVMDEGVPVLVSVCMTRMEIEKKFPGINTKMITAELFSVYDRQGKMLPGFQIDLEIFFKPEQTLYFYSQKNVIPHEAVKGNIKLMNY